MFSKLRFRLELLYHHLKKRWFFILIGFVVGIIALTNYKKILNYYQQNRHSVSTIGIKGLYTRDNLPESISTLISTGLTTLNTNNKPQPSSLVQSIDSQEDQLRYIFHLRPGIYWHNLQPFNSSHISYQPKGVKLTPLDPNTLQITLELPYSPILSDLSHPLFLPNSLIGLGDYKVTTATYQDGHLKLLSLRHTTLPKTIIYRFYSNETNLINAYKLGEVDQIEVDRLPPEFSQWPKTVIHQNIDTNSRYLAVFFNTQKINNKQTRQALSYATPKTSDLHERSFGPISPNSWAYNSKVKEYDFNPQRAKELFKDNTIDQITLLVLDRNLLDTANAITKSWKDILNIDAHFSLENQPPSDYDAILSLGAIPTDPDQYAFWHSTQKTNITHLNNSRIDKLLEEGRQTYDQQERKKIYLDFQRFLLEESPATFLSFPITYTIQRS